MPVKGTKVQLDYAVMDEYMELWHCPSLVIPVTSWACDEDQQDVLGLLLFISPLAVLFLGSGIRKSAWWREGGTSALQMDTGGGWAQAGSQRHRVTATVQRVPVRSRLSARVFV